MAATLAPAPASGAESDREPAQKRLDENRSALDERWLACIWRTWPCLSLWERGGVRGFDGSIDSTPSPRPSPRWGEGARPDAAATGSLCSSESDFDSWRGGGDPAGFGIAPICAGFLADLTVRSRNRIAEALVDFGKVSPVSAGASGYPVSVDGDVRPIAAATCWIVRRSLLIGPAIGLDPLADGRRWSAA